MIGVLGASDVKRRSREARGAGFLGLGIVKTRVPWSCGRALKPYCSTIPHHIYMVLQSSHITSYFMHGRYALETLPVAYAVAAHNHVCQLMTVAPDAADPYQVPIGIPHG